MMRRFSPRAAALAGMLLLGALIPALAQQRAPAVVGDVNGDGRLTSADALAVHAYLVGRPIPATFDVPGRGDADGDGRITRADAALIMRVAVGQASGDRPVGKPATPGTVPAEGPLRLQCVADVRGKSVRCAEPAAATPAGLRADRIVYGGQHLYVSLLTGNVTTQADTFAFDMSVKNLIPQAIGTNDGTTVDPVKVFFGAEPQNTSVPSNGGIVTAANHDGAEAFTTSEPQKFYAYGEIIQPQATSQPRRWKLRVDPGVQSFVFFLYVSSPVVHARGYVDVYPSTAEIPVGATLQLSDTVRGPLGRPVAGATATWWSANPDVATVSAEGLVTALADGVVEIVASSAPRDAGKLTLSVRTASVDSSTLTASPATLPVHESSLVTLRLRSANGSPLTRGGGTVVLSASAGILTAVTDHGDGSYTASLAHTAVEVVKVSGTLNGNTLRDTARVTFTVGAASKLVVVTQPSDSALSGVPFPRQPAVRLQDAYGNVVAQSGVGVTAAIATGGGTLGGNVTVNTDASGTATFDALSVSGASGARTLSFSAMGLSGVASGTVTVQQPAGPTVASVDCQADRAGATVDCGTSSDGLVHLMASNVTYDSGTRLFQFDVTVRNLANEAIGTPDGVRADTGGIKVYVAQGPTATSGSGSISVENPDGSEARPFFRYGEILPRDAVSSAKSWRMQVPSTVNTFTFRLDVSTDVQPLLVINEIMVSPGGTILDGNGEWIEIYNAGNRSVNMENMVIADSAASGRRDYHLIASSLVVPPGGYVTLGNTTNTASNGGVPIDYAYGGAISFPASLDAFKISRVYGADTLTIDRTQYANGAISGQEGVSRELKNPGLDNSNMDGSNWGNASVTSVYGAGGRGTPRAQNSVYTP